LRILIKILNRLDYHGKYPSKLAKEDPFFSSVFITNLGSIKMNANYHHLANWGTNSFFAVIGEKKKHPFFDDNGKYQLKDSLDISMTIDERIADGTYFAASIKILRYLLQHPELLELPANKDIAEEIKI
jgi:pyruvate/2-oxoglutarate dehydrogenase complex dihydrolipoamide acyltransferase (E2) component